MKEATVSDVFTSWSRAVAAPRSYADRTRCRVGHAETILRRVQGWMDRASHPGLTGSVSVGPDYLHMTLTVQYDSFTKVYLIPTDVAVGVVRKALEQNIKTDLQTYLVETRYTK